MFPRVRFLSVLAIVCGGLVCWSLMPQPSSGQNSKSETPAQKKSAASEKTAAIPAPPLHRAEGDFDLYEPDKAEQKIEKALYDPQGVEIEYIDTPLKEAMEFLADAEGITILIDNQALTEEGIGNDQQINRILSGVKLASALKIILDPLGLTYVVEDEVLKITTKDAADKRPVTCVYDTGYLREVGVEPEALAKTIQTIVEPNTWLASMQQAHLVTGPQKEMAVLQEAPTAPDRRKAQTDSSVFHFQGAVLRTVQYAGNAGQAGKPAAKAHEPKSSIQVLGDMLVIEAPQSVHRKIRDLLIQIDRRWELAQKKK